MSGGMPELGSKISLISKADIRYEGRLFTVDPQECTIALANVRSFGTEDRETQYPIAPQSQIYDYILFRGSDIKDIRVVNNGMPHPNDPAIMQIQLPNGQPLISHFPAIPTMGSYGNPPFGAMGSLGGIGTTAGLAPGAFGLNKAKQPSELNDAIPEASTMSAPTAAEHKDQDLLTGASRSTTPVSLISRKSPSADMGVQVNQNAVNRDQGGHNRRQNQHQQRSGNVGGGGGNGQRDRRDSGKVLDQQHNQHQDHKNQNRNHMQNNNQNRGWMNRGNNNNNMRGNRGRGRMHNQGNFQRDQNVNFRQGANNNKARAKNPLKFDQDYDFEQANNQFEELRSQLDKLKVSDEPKTEQVPKVNGEIDKKDDSGNETGAGEHEPEEDGVVGVGYDKSKSFFDNISCEAATDRTKGKNRTDWRQERKLNSETFGISSTRRGNYRSRGGYYNRNMNMHGGGGGYRGYRGGNNYRGRNNNNNRGAQQSTGLPKSKNPNQSQQPNNQPQASIQSQQTVQQPQPQPVAAAAGN